ncbi:MAG: hypothetical protein AB7U95_27995 [Reyranella sp.]
MGLNAYIYRNQRHGQPQDFSNSGISSWAEEVCLVNVDGPFDPRPGTPAAFLVRGAYPGIARVVPAVQQGECWLPDSRWAMMGGAYVATSDSRFVRAVEEITGGRWYGAVPLHDRFEDGEYARSQD